MIEKLERTQSHAYQNKDQAQNPTNKGRYIKQWINNRTAALSPILTVPV